MDDGDALVSALVDHAIAAGLAPYACPCDFADRYRLEELVAAGPHSLVYRATDKTLSSEGFSATVAIKVHRQAQTPRPEALTARRVTHPNVLAILDRGETPDGLPYLVAEYVDGGDLSTIKLPLPPRQAAALMVKIASAVHAAHSAGIVHCDLKPANILQTKAGEPKLADFGLSRWTIDAGEASRGNVAFMSPEQFRKEPDALTPPSDIYALGGLLFHLFTGRLPHGDTPEQVARTRREQTRPQSPRIEPDLDRVCMRAMALERSGRHHSAGELAEDLERWLNHEPLAWTHPSVLRRARLNARRHPIRAVAFVGMLAAFVGTAGVLQYNTVRDHRRQVGAQAEAIRLANKEIESLKALGRKQLQMFANAVVALQGGDLQDRILPALVWVQWVGDSSVVQNDGRIPGADERVLLLRAVLAEREASGGGQYLDAMLARYALAHFLLLQGESGEVSALLDQLDGGLSPVLSGSDPVHLSLRAMRLCGRANAALARGEPLGELSDELAKAAADLERSGTADATKRLVERVLARAKRAGS